jgi:hypothetical protein
MRYRLSQAAQMRPAGLTLTDFLIDTAKESVQQLTQ